MKIHLFAVTILVSLTMILIPSQNAWAKVQLPSIFSNGMTLQRGRSICIWGKSAALEHVSVEIDRQLKTTVADGKGDWSVQVGPLEAGTARSLTVLGTNRIEIKDVNVGDVFLCSGQSNMALELGASDVAQEDIDHLDKVPLRIYTTPNQTSKSEIFDPHGAWRKMTTESVMSFPAIPYQFGRSLFEIEKVPVGIISASCCGASLESFLPAETEKRINCGMNPLLKPGTRGSNFRTLLYPFLKFGLKGIVWYQGESNILNAHEYASIFPAFIADLRKRMHSPDLPFYFVQLANYGWRNEKQAVDSFWADLREAQAQALGLENVAMVVSIDTAQDDGSLHPKNKREIAKRLALLAAGQSQEKLLSRRPRLKEQCIKGDTMTLLFDTPASGFATADGAKPRGFQLAGPDKRFYFAEAELLGSAIKVSCDDVFTPVAVRYAWADNPDGNVSCDGQPLAPFRTDRWTTNPKLNPAATQHVAEQ